MTPPRAPAPAADPPPGDGAPCNAVDRGTDIRCDYRAPHPVDVPHEHDTGGYCYRWFGEDRGGHHRECPRGEVPSYDCRCRVLNERDAAVRTGDELTTTLRALVATLPPCRACVRRTAATHRNASDGRDYCDAHRDLPEDVIPHGYAAAMRTAAALLARLDAAGGCDRG